MKPDTYDMLRCLAAQSGHDGLAAMETRVVEALARPRARSFDPGTATLAIALALVLGLASNAISTEQRGSSLSPLGAPGALAPSTLLAEIE